MSEPLITPKESDEELLSRELVAEVREISRSSSDLVAFLADQTGRDRSESASMLARALDMQCFNMKALAPLSPDFSKWSFAEASNSKAVVLSENGRSIGVTANPFDLALQLRVEACVQAPLAWSIADPLDIAAYLKLQEHAMRAMGHHPTAEAEDGLPNHSLSEVSIVSISEETAPVIRLINSTLYDAMKAGASDVHLETSPSSLVVKFRIDGVLSQVAVIQGSDMADQAVSRVKVMAGLDIGERRVPQDGRFKLAMQGREIDFRVSIMPSLFGEDVVIRILDKQALTAQFQSLRLDILGFDERTLEQMRQLASEPYGMVLVTGPTGSGKTTTLYAALSEIHTGQDKIITIEDPIEYQLPGILQIPVNDKKGMGFARGLRSILRHDPDKILVGEIRDSETAQIAIQSALTGHLVFTSVHANNVFDVIGRFLHMGVDAYSFVSCLNGVVGQRLIRVNCPDCVEPAAPSDDKLRKSGIGSDQAAGMRFLKGCGCGTCRGTGYKGRVAIGEVLLVNDRLREMIAARAPISAVKQEAREHGTRFLRDAAIHLLSQGRTTLEEINRVTFAD